MSNFGGYVSDVTATSWGTWHFYRPTSTGSGGYGGYADVFAIGMWK